MSAWRHVRIPALYRRLVPALHRADVSNTSFAEQRVLEPDAD
jgi:hypothetical protein